MPAAWTRLGAFACACALTALVACAAAQNAAAPSEPAALTAPQPRLVSYDGSAYAAQDLKLHLRPSQDGYALAVTIAEHAAGPAADEPLLLEVRFDPRWQAADVESGLAGGRLSLLSADRPGVVALGVIPTAGEPVRGAGLVLSCVLEPAQTRTLSLAPDISGVVTDLAGQRIGGTVELSWSYVNAGDYDQNSEVNIADITALAARLGESATDGQLDEWDRVLDGSGDGEVNIADLTPLGANLLRRVARYDVFKAETAAPDPETDELVAQVDFAASVLQPRERRRFGVVLSEPAQQDARFYYVRPADGSDDTAGPPGNVAEVDAPDTAPPIWETTVGVTELLPGDGRITVLWNRAVDSGSPPVRYTVYYNVGTQVEFGSAQQLEVVDQLGAVVTGLANGTTYAFAVRAADSASPPNGELNEVQLSEAPTDVIFDLAPDALELAALASWPDIALLPQSQSVAEAAPVVSWVEPDGRLRLAHHRGSQWRLRDIEPDLRFSGQALLAEGGRRVIVAFDPASRRLLRLDFNSLWEQLSSAVIDTAPAGLGLRHLDLAATQTGARLGIAYAFADLDHQSFEPDRCIVKYAETDAAGTTVLPALLEADELCAGLTLGFDPAGQGWLYYTHGTEESGDDYYLETALIEAQVGAGGAAQAAIPHGSEPLNVDLAFADGRPTLALTAARTRLYPLVGDPFYASLQFDGEVGSRDGAGVWTFTRFHSGSMNAEVEGGFPPEFYRFNFNGMLDARWAGSGAIAVTRLQGYMIVDAVTLVPSSRPEHADMLQLTTEYRISATGYSAGDALPTGLAYRWDARAGRLGAAAVLPPVFEGEQVYDRLLIPQGPLSYWQP